MRGAFAQNVAKVKVVIPQIQNTSSQPSQPESNQTIFSGKNSGFTRRVKQQERTSEEERSSDASHSPRNVNKIEEPLIEVLLF